MVGMDGVGVGVGERVVAMDGVGMGHEVDKVGERAVGMVRVGTGQGRGACGRDGRVGKRHEVLTR